MDVQRLPIYSDVVPRAPDLDLVLAICPTGTTDPDVPTCPNPINWKDGSIAYRRVPAGAEGVDARGRSEGAATRHTQGLTEVPRHMPRLAFLASYRAT